jgi:RNA polymerase sigma-70 factor (ECF subfamily)
MPAIFRYCRLRLGDPARAEDATADVFEQAWRSADSYEDRGLPPRAWLFGIARHVVGSHRRWLVRQPPHLALEAFDGPATDSGLHTDRLDLAQAIAALDAAHAEVITLRFIHDLPLAVTADALGVTVDAVKGRQARALAALRALLE